MRLDIPIRARGPASLAFLVALSAARAAAGQAEPPRVRLEYAVDADARGCPAQGVVQREIAERLGRDPFAPDAESVVRATIAHDHAGLRASVRIVDARGSAGPARAIRTPREDDCEALGRAVVLAIVIALDPQALTRAPPAGSASSAGSASAPTPSTAASTDATTAPTVVPRAAAPPRSTPPSRTTPPRPRAPRAYGSLALRAVGGYGLEPTLSAGALLAARIRVAFVSVGLEAWSFWPGSTTFDGGGVAGWASVGMLVPCAWLGPVALCAVAAAGALVGQGRGFHTNASAVQPMLAVGARAMLSVPVTRWLEIELHVDGLVALTRNELDVSDADAWTSSPISGIVGIGPRVDFR